MLGACKLKDIGSLFSDKNYKYKNIRSTKLLQKVVSLIKSQNYSINNIGDATANNVKIRFKVEFTPVTNMTGSQTNWFSDIIDLNTIDSGVDKSGSIIAQDYNYYNGTSLTTYTNVRVYLYLLSFDG